jgi:hypothetical protein
MAGVGSEGGNSELIPLGSDLGESPFQVRSFLLELGDAVCGRVDELRHVVCRYLTEI